MAVVVLASGILGDMGSAAGAAAKAGSDMCVFEAGGLRWDEVVKGLVDLTLHLFQTYLKISLEILQEVLLVVQAEDHQVIEEMI